MKATRRFHISGRLIPCADYVCHELRKPRIVHLFPAVGWPAATRQQQTDQIPPTEEKCELWSYVCRLGYHLQLLGAMTNYILHSSALVAETH